MGISRRHFLISKFHDFPQEAPRAACRFATPHQAAGFSAALRFWRAVIAAPASRRNLTAESIEEAIATARWRCAIAA
jgi:hypothetical protein